MFKNIAFTSLLSIPFVIILFLWSYIMRESQSDTEETNVWIKDHNVY